MFGASISIYSDNLDSLRDFVAVVRPVLERRNKDIFNADLVSFAPVLLAFDALGIEGEQLGDDVKARLRKAFDGEIRIDVAEGDDTGAVTLSVEGKGKSAFDEKLKQLSKQSYQTELLHNNALISLVSSTEWFLSQLLHKYYDAFPESAGIKGRSLTLKELQEIGTVEEAREYLLEEHIEGVLRGSFSEWMEFLKASLHLSMSYVDEFRDQMVEVYQRRNLLVHNGGIVNGIYLNKVPESVRPAVKVGHPIALTHSYLDTSISTFERCFILIGLELWKKLDPGSEDRAHIANQITYSHLISERWEIAESISFFSMNDKKIPESFQLYGQVNYWQALKWSGRFDEVRSDIERTDFSAKQEIFVLAQAALLDDVDRFFSLLPSIVGGGKLTRSQLEEWPLFALMRQSDKYRDYTGDKSLSGSEPERE